MKKLVFIAAALLVFSASVTASTGGDIVVVSASPAGEELTQKTLEKIYMKKKVFWQNGSAIVAVNLPSGSAVRGTFTKSVLKRSSSTLVDYWNEQHFKGVSPPVVLESEEAVKKFVKEVDGAVGYITRKKLEPGLHVLYEVRAEEE